MDTPPLYPQHLLSGEEVFHRLIYRGWDPTTARIAVVLRNSRPDIAHEVAVALAD